MVCLENLNVLITGASSGIGYELAKVFAKNKNNLILVARNGERLEELRQELSRHGIHVTTIQKDLAQVNAALEVHQELRRRNISVHVLVNNAGVGLYGGFQNNGPDEQLRMIQLNTVALTQLTHVLVRDMIDNQFGRILNVASISSFLSTPMMSVYAATKAYVLSLSESLNSELKGKGNLSVTALCPGFTNTNFITEAKMGRLESLIYKIAMSPEQVACVGYEALKQKKSVKVVGKLYVNMYLLMKMIPRSWVQKIASIVFKDQIT